MFNWTKGLLGSSGNSSSNLVKINTLIGEGTVINGDIELTGSIKIDGIVNGNITTSADVIVEESATVYGEISAECALISGTTEGNIYAHDQVTIASTARVKGNVTTPGFVVDVGSEFIGKCEIIEREVLQKAEFLLTPTDPPKKPLLEEDLPPMVDPSAGNDWRVSAETVYETVMTAPNEKQSSAKAPKDQASQLKEQFEEQFALNNE